MAYITGQLTFYSYNFQWWLPVNNIVRNSSGIPYVVVCESNSRDIRVYKGNSATPTSFSEQDSSNNPVASTRYGNASAAIDNTGKIHIVYCDDNGATPALRYVVFDTSTNTYSGDTAIISDLGADMGSLQYMESKVCLDSNYIPHVFYSSLVSNMGTSYKTLLYNNRIGGAWNSSSVVVQNESSSADAYKFSCSVDKNDYPYVIFSKETPAGSKTGQAAVGNANDATSFTIQQIAGSSTTVTILSSSCDSSGDIYAMYIDTASSTYKIYVQRHINTNAWSTWETTVDTGAVAKDILTPDGAQVMMNGTTLYIIYVRTSDGYICYRTSANSGSTWSSEVVMESAYTNSHITVRHQRFADYTSSGSNLVTSTSPYTRSTDTIIDVFSAANLNYYFSTTTLSSSAVKKVEGVTQATIKKILGTTNATAKKILSVTNV